MFAIELERVLVHNTLSEMVGLRLATKHGSSLLLHCRILKLFCRMARVILYCFVSYRYSPMSYILDKNHKNDATHSNSLTAIQLIGVPNKTIELIRFQRPALHFGS
jgi:hypothetical protein